MRCYCLFIKVLFAIALFLLCSLNVMSSSLPKAIYLKQAIHIYGPVLAGYGRGGKKLGVPTANHPQFDEFLKENNIPTGVYFGWGQVEGESISGVVANVGYSPTFVGEENKVMTIESHVLNREMKTDFYGKNMHIILGVYLRPEVKYAVFQDLIAQIAIDIADSHALVDEALVNKSVGAVKLRTTAISAAQRMCSPGYASVIHT